MHASDYLPCLFAQLQWLATSVIYLFCQNELCSGVSGEGFGVVCTVSAYHSFSTPQPLSSASGTVTFLIRRARNSGSRLESGSCSFAVPWRHWRSVTQSGFLLCGESGQANTISKGRKRREFVGDWAASLLTTAEEEWRSAVSCPPESGWGGGQTVVLCFKCSECFLHSPVILLGNLRTLFGG